MSASKLTLQLLILILLVGSVYAQGQQSAHLDPHVPALNSDDVAVVKSRLTENSGPDGIPLYTPGNLDMSLELPGPPKLLESQRLSRQITDSRCFASAGDGIGVFIGYSINATQYDLNEYAKEFVSDVQARAGLADLKYSAGPTSGTRIPLYGTFKVGGVVGELNGLVLSRGSRAWVVLAVYPRNKEGSHELADRILHSIVMTDGPDPHGRGSSKRPPAARRAHPARAEKTGKSDTRS